MLSHFLIVLYSFSKTNFVFAFPCPMNSFQLLSSFMFATISICILHQNFGSMEKRTQPHKDVKSKPHGFSCGIIVVVLCWLSDSALFLSSGSTHSSYWNTNQIISLLCFVLYRGEQRLRSTPKVFSSLLHLVGLHRSAYMPDHCLQELPRHPPEIMPHNIDCLSPFHPIFPVCIPSYLSCLLPTVESRDLFSF